MNKTDEDRIRAWVYSVWPLHWKELAPKSNSRAQFLKFALRDKKKDDELLKIQRSIEAQTAAWREQSRKEKVIGIPTLSVWYNQGRWEDDISHNNLDRPKTILGECQREGCSKDVHGKNYDYCTFHVAEKGDRWKERRAQAGLELGLMPREGESKSDWVTRCREMGKPKLQRLKSGHR